VAEELFIAAPNHARRLKKPEDVLIRDLPDDAPKDLVRDLPVTAIARRLRIRRAK